MTISGTGGVPPTGYDGKWPITAAPYSFPTAGILGVTNYGFPASFNFTFTIPTATGLADVNEFRLRSHRLARCSMVTWIPAKSWMSA